MYEGVGFPRHIVLNFIVACFMLFRLSLVNTVDYCKIVASKLILKTTTSTVNLFLTRHFLFSAFATLGYV